MIAYVYRVIDIDDYIRIETTSLTEAREMAQSYSYARIETRREDYDTPKYDGSNYGLLRWMSCEECD